jgi:hypothetical protein
MAETDVVSAYGSETSLTKPLDSIRDGRVLRACERGPAACPTSVG